jgi:hypothetical protein
VGKNGHDPGGHAKRADGHRRFARPA